MSRTPFAAINRRSIRISAVLLLAVMGACRNASVPPATQAADDASAAPPTLDVTHMLSAERWEQTQDFLRSRYVAQAGLDGAWEQSVRLPEAAGDEIRDWTVRYAVCAQRIESTAQNVRMLLLAVCGTLPDAGHPDPGVIDFYLLREQSRRWQLLSSAQHFTFGSSGYPGSVEALQLGADLYGFNVLHRWAGQGYLLESQTLVMPHAGTFKEVATLRRGIDNEGLFDITQDCDDHFTVRCHPEAAFSLRFDLSTDQRNPQARIYPLQIHEHGFECGRIVDTHHRLDFDERHFQYPVPDALTREDCLVNTAE